MIWVLSDNPARFFYQRLGGKEVRRKTLPVGGAQVGATGFGWRELNVLVTSKDILGLSFAFLPAAGFFQRIGDFRRHVFLVVLGEHTGGGEHAVGRSRPSATTPCPSRNRSGRMPS